MRVAKGFFPTCPTRLAPPTESTHPGHCHWQSRARERCKHAPLQGQTHVSREESVVEGTGRAADQIVSREVARHIAAESMHKELPAKRPPYAAVRRLLPEPSGAKSGAATHCVGFFRCCRCSAFFRLMRCRKLSEIASLLPAVDFTGVLEEAALAAGFFALDVPSSSSSFGTPPTLGNQHHATTIRDQRA